MKRRETAIENGEVTIKGTVDSITYRNDDNGFGVIVLDFAGDPLTVVGELGNVEEGEELELTGQFMKHPKFGEQFRAEFCIRTLPVEASAIQRYLAGGVVKGIGPVLAKKLVEMFKEKTLEIMESEPERLCVIEGITIKKAQEFSDEFKKVMGFRTLLSYFTAAKIPALYGIRAWKKYAENALALIEKNPYILCSLGIELPFLKAEEIASEKGISKESDLRLAAGIKYILEENANAGHTALPQEKLTEIGTSLLEVDSDLVYSAIQKEIGEENLFLYLKKNRPFIMLRSYFVAENYIAGRLAIMNSLSYDAKINYDEVIDIAEQENGIEYASKQREAINTALSKGFMVLTGGPGTGKTTTLNAIISLYEQQGIKPLVCAPTGRAAKRASDLTGREAKTIHRLLGVRADSDYIVFEHNEENLLDCDAVIIDEMSMVDALLFEALLRALPIDCKLIMVGDSDQLPSVGAGNVLHDIIASKTVPVISLTEIFRQAEKSQIVTNAHKIVKGEMPELDNKGDFFFLQSLDFEAATQLTVDLLSVRLPKAYGLSPINDIQVLTPTRKGPLGTVELNRRLQEALNPKDRKKSEIKTFLYTFRTGDKVMQTKNDYEIEWKKGEERGMGIFNGDIGVITHLNKILGEIEIDFDGRKASYSVSMLDNLELAYAATVHKSQGSEFEAVVLPILGGYDKLYFRNLLYTAVTRAKKLIVIVGSVKRLEFMISNNRRMNRYTCLKEMLREEAFGEADEQDEQSG